MPTKAGVSVSFTYYWIFQIHSSLRSLRSTQILVLSKQEVFWGIDCIQSASIKNLEILSVACGTQMTSLHITKCKKLKRLPERMQELLPSLNTLILFNCPEIESFPEGGLPFNLQLLYIGDCEKLVNSRKDWLLQGLPCLRGWIYHGGSDEEIVADENWELPCSIRQLSIHNLKTLSSQVLKSFTSLEYLRIENLPQIQSLLEEGLRHLTLLRNLQISSCDQLQSLAESALPSSLSELTNRECPNLQPLPVKGMPSSLYTIYSQCPLLKPFLEFDKGEYWPKSAHISTIEIDDEYLYCLKRMALSQLVDPQGGLLAKIAHISTIN